MWKNLSRLWAGWGRKPYQWISVGRVLMDVLPHARMSVQALHVMVSVRMVVRQSVHKVVLMAVV